MRIVLPLSSRAHNSYYLYIWSIMQLTHLRICCEINTVNPRYTSSRWTAQSDVPRWLRPPIEVPTLQRIHFYEIFRLYYKAVIRHSMSWDSSVWRLWHRTEDRVSITGRGKECLSSRQRPDRHWGSPSHLFNGYRWIFLRGGKTRGATNWPFTLI
jgi:hypothetical protein